VLSVIRVSKKKFFVLVWRHRTAYRRGIRAWTPPAHLFSGQDRLRRLRALRFLFAPWVSFSHAVYKDFI
jgi:hypothetical protein